MAGLPIPVWTYFLQGAEQWAKDTGNTVNTSFHSASAKPARSRACCHRRRGPTASARPAPTRARWLKWWLRRGRRASPSSTSIRQTTRPNGNAYVGGDLRYVGRTWAQYLVDKGLVKEGDFVWMPVEVRRILWRRGGEGHRRGLHAVEHHLGSDRCHARSGRNHPAHDGLRHRQPRQDQGDDRPRRHGDGSGQARLGRAASSRARSRWSAGATRSTPPRG